MKKIFALLLLLTSAAFGAVSFVQASPPGGGAGTSAVATFGSNVTPGDAACIFAVISGTQPTDAFTVTDGNSSSYVFAGWIPVSAWPTLGTRLFLGAWCTGNILGPASHLSITLTFPRVLVGRALAAEYSSVSGVGNTSIQVSALPTCGIPARRGFSYNPCATGPLSMSTGSISVSAGSLVAEFGVGVLGLPTVSSPWTSRASDAASLIALGDQVFVSSSSGVAGTMTDPANPDQWALLVIELKM